MNELEPETAIVVGSMLFVIVIAGLAALVSWAVSWPRGA